MIEHAAPQWNTYTCGPAALRCALLVYGDRVDGRRLARLAGTDPQVGTDEDGLRAAAEEFGCRIRHELIHTADVAAERIRANLEDGKPILLCVDKFEHWIVAVPKGRYGTTKRHVYVCDPARDGDEVLRRYTWRQLLTRVIFGLPDETRFDLYVVELIT